MTIKQLSVFLENREGRLDEVLKTLGANDVNIVALSLADTADYGMLRMIVSDPMKGKAVLKEAGIKAEIDTRNEKMNYKIRESQTKKIPYTLVLGDKEVANNEITYRQHGTNNSVSDTTEGNVLTFAEALINNGGEKDFSDLINALSFSLQMMSDYNFNFNASVTRGEAANYFKALAE